MASPTVGGTAPEGHTGAAPGSSMGKETAVSHIDDNGDKLEPEDGEGMLPSHMAPIEALGIENWRELEKKLVKRLDLTMMPCLWVSRHLDTMNSLAWS